MTKTYASTAGATAPKSWGWEQPGCRGPAALALFIDDLHRILQEHAAGKLASCSTLADAQSQVDAARALQRHRPRAGSVPGQSVELKEGVDRSGVSHTVPIFRRA